MLNKFLTVTKYFLTTRNFFLLQGHRELFTDEILNPFLEGATIKTDEQRIHEVGLYKLFQHYLSES